MSNNCLNQYTPQSLYEKIVELYLDRVNYVLKNKTASVKELAYIFYGLLYFYVAEWLGA